MQAELNDQKESFRKYSDSVNNQNIYILKKYRNNKKIVVFSLLISFVILFGSFFYSKTIVEGLYISKIERLQENIEILNEKNTAIICQLGSLVEINKKNQNLQLKLNQLENIFPQNELGKFIIVENPAFGDFVHVSYTVNEYTKKLIITELDFKNKSIQIVRNLNVKYKIIDGNGKMVDSGIKQIDLGKNIYPNYVARLKWPNLPPFLSNHKLLLRFENF